MVKRVKSKRQQIERVLAIAPAWQLKTFRDQGYSDGEIATVLNQRAKERDQREGQREQVLALWKATVGWNASGC